jgi:hypothetical protein
VRLENGDQLSIADHGAGRLQSGGHLGWVVSEVVVNLYLANFPVKLKSALGSTEGFNAIEGSLGIEPKSH